MQSLYVFKNTSLSVVSSIRQNQSSVLACDCIKSFLVDVLHRTEKKMHLEKRKVNVRHCTGHFKSFFGDVLDTVSTVICFSPQCLQCTFTLPCVPYNLVYMLSLQIINFVGQCIFGAEKNVNIILILLIRQLTAISCSSWRCN